MLIKIHSSLDEIAPYQDEWDQLALMAPQANPIMSYAWLACFFELCVPIGEWLVVTAEQDGQLVGVLPLIKASKKLFGISVKYYQLPKNNHTLSVDALVRDGYQDEVLPALHKEVLNQSSGVSFIKYNRIDASSKNFLYLAAHANLDIQIDLSDYGYGLGIQTDYADYISTLGKNHRSNLKRWKNKLAGYSNSKWHFSSTASKENFENVFELENKGWKGKNRSSVLSDPYATRYFQAVAEALARKKWLEYQFLLIDEKIIAANFSIKFSNRVVLWKLTYDENFSKLSPGSLLLDEIIQRAILSEEQIDLMTNESWYENWSMKKRPFYDIWVFGSGVVAKYLMVAMNLRQVMSSFKRKFLSYSE